MSTALDELAGRLRLAVEQWRAAPVPQPDLEATLQRLRASGHPGRGRLGLGWRLLRVAVAAAILVLLLGGLIVLAWWLEQRAARV